jgi:hypothetical protein
MTYISDFLFWITTGLLIPVIVILLLLFIRALLLLGTFFGQYLGMRHTIRFIKKHFDTLTVDGLTSLKEQLPTQRTLPLLVYAHRILDAKGSEQHIERLLSQFEIDYNKEIGTPALLAKLGPQLGLMGTLIPMGPALVGLSTGDIASMAYNMQVAFATTVIGLFSAGVGMITMQVKRRWFMQQRTQLEFLADLILENKGRV